MAIIKSDQINLEGKQFRVEYISQAIANNSATTLTMQAKANMNPNEIAVVGLVVQNIGFQGTDYLAGPVTWTVTSGKPVVTLNYGSGAGTYMVRFALFYLK